MKKTLFWTGAAAALAAAVAYAIRAVQARQGHGPQEQASAQGQTRTQPRAARSGRGRATGAGRSAQEMLERALQPERLHGSTERLPGEDIDLNKASAEQLKALEGIDDELADRIIENRPYATKLGLLNRFVVPEAVYEAIKDRLYVEHSPETASLGEIATSERPA